MNIEKLFDELFPIDRSILGNGYRKSIEIFNKIVPFKYFDYKSETKVFDWIVPKEWIVKSATLYDSKNKKIIDYNSKSNNLSLLNYSCSYFGTLDLEKLKNHIFYDKKLPDAIPYVTSYYNKNWGFSMSYNNFKKLKTGKYKIDIQTNFIDGFLRVGECLLKGKIKNEIIISSYLCHPSLANNELSGPLALADLYTRLKKINLNYSYRFVMNPETIGSICYLSNNLESLKKNVVGGLVLTCLGGRNKKLSYKFSKQKNSILDKFFVRKKLSNQILTRDFTPMGGSDERQYNSPMIDLPVGQLAKTIYGEYDEYHTSNDNKEFMNIESLKNSCDNLFNLIIEFDSEKRYFNENGFGELQLGKRNMYPSINSKLTREKSSNDTLIDGKTRQKIIIYLLNYSDGKHSLNDIAMYLNQDIANIEIVAKELAEKNLLKKI
ncbi:DUF4910 domain-containing protein [Flavobacteriaceae bacterium]|nr:DUF4910 domain-containing protein [Flavobacteriaceae bacterium]